MLTQSFSLRGATMHLPKNQTVQTPHGPVHHSCVHLIESGRPVDTRHTGLPRCEVPAKNFSELRALSPNGWVESATFALDVPLRSISVTFQVPEPPATPGAL